jgi:glycerol-3-phosphate dehydrogenase
MAPEVADLMAQELGKDESWKSEQLEAFKQVAKNYFLEA